MAAEGVPVLRLVLLWAGWCALHSLLITAKTNAWVRRTGGAVAGLARLLYVMIAVLTFFPLLWYQSSFSGAVLFGWSGPWSVLRALLLAYAAVMFVGGGRVYSLGYFLGFRQWRDYREGRAPADLPFRVDGVLRWVRHPWYSGGLAFLWAYGPVTTADLPGRLVLAAYLLVGSVLEERKLGDEIGARYAEYRRRVPMLVPWRGRVDV